MHESNLSVMGVLYNAFAVLAERGIRTPERTQDGGGGGDFIGLRQELVCNLVN
jgi:hypothetical protein